MIIARLNAKARPLDRGQYFEDPLDAALREQGLGSVAGGGTAQSESGEISYCVIEIEASPQAIPFIAETLDGLGAPKGSVLVEGSGVESPFGKSEGMGVYLNGTALPKDVYASCDVNFVISEFGRLLGSQGRVLSYWEGRTETALYVYGASFSEMKGLLEPFIAEYPLCEKSRVVEIA